MNDLIENLTNLLMPRMDAIIERLGLIEQALRKIAAAIRHADPHEK